MLKQLQQHLADLFSVEVIAKRLVDVVPGLLAAIIVFAAFYGLAVVLTRVAAAIMNRAHVDATAANFIQTILKYAIVALGLVSALSQIGIDITSILASLGILGLTIGFAARDTLSNIISGIFIFWDRPFVLNDLVEISGNYGRVASITLRSTRIVTVDGRMLAIPNTTVVNSIVASYTNFPHFRVEVDATIGVGEDVAQARALMLALVEHDPAFMQEPKPQVVIAALNDYNVALKLQAWITDERDHIAVTFALREKVFTALRTAGVEMPYETLQLAPMQVQASVTQRG